MLLARYADTVVVRAPAKVNLHLEILGKRPDGYHALETLMVAVNLCDTLAFRDDPAGRLSLACTQADLSTGPDNLVLKAAELLRVTAGCQRGASIRLVKRIPVAAGLAGGSTDAAATLAGLNELWGLGLDRATLGGLGARLGSDITFFFHTPAAWCTGRGEVVTPARLGRLLWLVLLCPPFGLSTAEVYRKVTVPAAPVGGDAIRQAAAAGDVEAIGRLLFNRLQEAATLVRPEVDECQRLLEALHPAGARMSGSGSTLFAVCRDRGEAVRIAHALRQRMDERLVSRVVLVRSAS